MKLNIRKIINGFDVAVCIVLLGFMIFMIVHKPSDEEDATEGDEAEKVLIDYDMVHKYDVDGWHINDSTGRSPMNQLIIYTDEDDSLMAMAGISSEACEYNFLRYLRNESGAIYGFASGIVEANDTVLYNIIRYKSEKDNKYELFMLQYDDKGQLVKVYNPNTCHNITIKDGWKMRYKVKKSDIFWESDLDGGMILLNFYVEHWDGTKHFIDKYYGYNKLYESCYQKGKLTELKIYSRNSQAQPVLNITSPVGIENAEGFIEQNLYDYWRGYI